MQNNIGLKHSQLSNALTSIQSSVSEEAGLRLLAEIIAINIVNQILQNDERKRSVGEISEWETSKGEKTEVEEW